MNDQKIENLLNLALDASQEEREKSEILETGYDAKERRWEVIIRYSGPLDADERGWQAVYLSGGYAILTVPQRDIALLASLPQVEYIEMPKRLYFSLDEGRAASCISAVQTPEMGLFGEGILVAVIDSGVDYFHPDFRNEDGSTRIVALWDQTEQPGGAQGGQPPQGFYLGAEYTREDIDQALSAKSREESYAIVPERDAGGHGTQVLGIAAGNGRASGGRFRGVAPRSDILVVKLGVPRAGGFPRTTELMQALEYVMRKAETLGMPVAVNLSFGNVYGSHRGTSLLETYMDMLALRGRNVIVAGTGNEGNAGGHVSGRLRMGQTQEISFLIDEFETSMNQQIWKDYADEYRITVIHPNGQTAGPFGREVGASRYRLGQTELLVYFGTPSPYQSRQEIFIDFLPADTYLDSGVWRVVLEPQRIVTGEYDLWMLDSRGRNFGTRFLQPTPDTTVTIPATAARVIAAGAYDARRNAYASFSGRGWPDDSFLIRPDLVAPGVDITTTAAQGGYVSVTGTSFAAPFVTGAAALLMQWGIVQGNDPYLYGEKVRAYLRKGARQLPGFEKWPNNQAGYGEDVIIRLH
ncbi:S8 family peptidase [Parablautia sp. Marseille-Q6255]|uniref:S8 family peptidase n=1 Tax=Parablautia sp. Marseille-Q6255 TaxID=3039593 RepID=UPI0024BC7AA8|nr:S8 family peptidase [Parablautia sp. Marseille-Q6255]